MCLCRDSNSRHSSWPRDTDVARVLADNGVLAGGVRRLVRARVLRGQRRGAPALRQGHHVQRPDLQHDPSAAAARAPAAALPALARGALGHGLLQLLAQVRGTLQARVRAAPPHGPEPVGPAADGVLPRHRRLPGRHHAALHGAVVAAVRRLYAPLPAEHHPGVHVAAQLQGAVPRRRGPARLPARGGGGRDVHGRPDGGLPPGVAGTFRADAGVGPDLDVLVRAPAAVPVPPHDRHVIRRARRRGAPLPRRPHHRVRRHGRGLGLPAVHGLLSGGDRRRQGVAGAPRGPADGAAERRQPALQERGADVHDGTRHGSPDRQPERLRHRQQGAVRLAARDDGDLSGGPGAVRVLAARSRRQQHLHDATLGHDTAARPARRGGHHADHDHHCLALTLCVCVFIVHCVSEKNITWQLYGFKDFFDRNKYDFTREILRGPK